VLTIFLMNRKLVIVQQYLSWKGHYRQYFENLHSPAYYLVYASNTLEKYTNAKWIKSDFDSEKPLTIKSKIKGRFLGSFQVFKYLSSSDFDIIHFIEFEPLTYLLFSDKIKAQLIITIHSSDKLHFSSWINNKLSGLQRWLLDTALRKATGKGAQIVTHYECHKESIVRIIGEGLRDKVRVIQYPAPRPKSARVKVLSQDGPRFLIYGQIRDDKGIYEFLSNDSTKELNITIAGKIVDRRVLELSERDRLTIIDKFLSEKEISELIDSHDYMLLPYPIAYTNGAGTFKDSLSMAMPVICSNIDIFREIIDEEKVGLIFENSNDIAGIVKNIKPDDYKIFSQNCLNYANKYNWDYMREEYLKIYEGLSGAR